MTNDELEAIQARDAADYPAAEVLRKLAGVAGNGDPEMQATIDMIADRRALLREVDRLLALLHSAGCICTDGADRADCPAHALYCRHGHIIGRHECDDSARGRGMSFGVYLLAEVERLRYLLDREATQLHTCSDDCPRLACRQRREIDRLRDWQRRAVDYIGEQTANDDARALIEEAQP